MGPPATQSKTADMPLKKRRALVRRLHDEGMADRAIARQLGIHHNTVARDLRATEPQAERPARTAPEPPAEPDRTTPAPPTATSTEPPAPQLIHTLPQWLTQDLNVLLTGGALPDPLARAIHAAAEERRAAWRIAEPGHEPQETSHHRATPTGHRA